MLKGFKDFILKGNVIELATAVIIGAAFTAIVKAFTDGIIQPLINSIGGSNTANGLGFQITDNANTFVNIGELITAAINFLIIAAVVYFIIIVPYNKLSELGGFGSKDEVTEVALLTEIRDLLGPDGTSKAKAQAEKELPDHLSGSSGSPLDAPPPTQRLVPPPPAPQNYPPQGPGGYPTPPPAPGSYPPPGTYPPGNYQPGQFPPDDAGRHSR